MSENKDSASTDQYEKLNLQENEDESCLLESASVSLFSEYQNTFKDNKFEKH